MADDVKMVVVNGVRYRPEDAPEKPTSSDDDGATVQHKARQPRKTAARSSSK
jgi:hypothetical protein